MDEPPTSSFVDYAGRRVTVMGLGHFGGNVGVVRFLAQHGARITLTDLLPAERLADSLAQIEGLPLETLRLGEHCEEDFTSADLVVASPAIRPDHPCLAAARQAGAPVTTEVGLFWRHCPAKIIAVTGTVGKSTTAAMIHHLLSVGGLRSHLGGNIGGSLLADLPQITKGDWVVLELSSFQLMYLDADRRSPQIAVVTNFAPNHLDWHTSLKEYRYAKQTLLRYQQPSDCAVLGTTDESRQWPTQGQATFPTLPAPAGDAGRIAKEIGMLPGEHNRLNAALAIAAATAAGAPETTCRTALDTFRGLPHRLEFIGEWQGRRFYNDSKATTPESAIAALRSFDRPVIALAGGSDKGVDLALFAVELARRAKAVALMGATGPELVRLIEGVSRSTTEACIERSAIELSPDAPQSPMTNDQSLMTNEQPPRLLAPDFPTAFHWALAQSAPGDIILLSPGCASFGWFRDYADRGDQFRRAVEELPT